jgi:hypothetical protein
MKSLGAAVCLVLGLSGAALIVPPTPALAQSFEIGPGGVRVDPYSDRYERRRVRRWERDDDDCRIVFERRRNRWGEMEERRREVCR